MKEYDNKADNTTNNYSYYIDRLLKHYSENKKLNTDIYLIENIELLEIIRGLHSQTVK